MAARETDHLDLYNGLKELLGSSRAETLMAALPVYDPTDIATKADLRHLEGRFDQLEARFDRLEIRYDVLSQRLDRLFLTLVAGLIVIVGAMAGTVVLP